MKAIHSNKLLVLVIFLFVVTVAIVYISTQGPRVVNPYKDSGLTAEEGRDYAALYMHGPIFLAIGENENTLGFIKSDIATFARETRPEFANKEDLVGFTFDQEVVSNGSVSVYTGHYYGLSDKIEIKLSSHGRGVFTLSITNKVDGTNIDDRLKLNGKSNKFITSLPIEKDGYSIRYNISTNKIIVSFYEPYTVSDVDEVESIINDALGSTDSNNVSFNINSKGSFSLDRIRDNINNPVSF